MKNVGENIDPNQGELSESDHNVTQCNSLTLAIRYLSRYTYD